MKNPRRLTVAAALLGIAALTFGVAAPAAAVDPIANAAALYQYKLATDISKAGAGFNPNLPAANWTGTSWQTQQAWQAEAVKASQRNISSFQAADGIAQVGYATQSAGPAAVTQVLTPTKVAEARAKYKLPAFSAAPLIKTVGGAATGFTGYALGAQVGSGVTSLFGMDANGLVCESSAAGFLSVLTAQDCSAFAAMPQFTPNQDASGSLYSAKSCGPAQYGCIELAGAGVNEYGQQGYCILVTGSSRDNGSTFGSGFAYKRDTGSESSVTFNVYQPGAPGGCSANTPSAFFVTTAKIVGVLAFGIDGAYVPVEEASANPERLLSCAITGDNGQTYSAQTIAFSETDATWPTPECPALPEGVNPTNMRITEEGGGQSNVLTDRPAEAGYADSVAAYPECQTGLCTLELVRLAAPLDTCFNLGEACNGWFQDAQKESKYACTYGSHKLPLSSCNVYAQVFDPAMRAAGMPYADPKTGSNVPGVQTGPTAGGDAYKTPVQDPGGMRDCLGATSLSNPISLVMVPVQCALEWAFVPRPAVLSTNLNKIGTSALNTPAGQMQTAVSGWDLQVPNGCDGFTIDVFFLGDPFSLANACPGSMLAPIAFWANLFAYLMTAVAGFLSIRGSVAGVAAFRGGDA